MKGKLLALGLTAVVATVGICGAVGCTQDPELEGNYITTAIARESGSGTRGAFDELVVSADGVALEDALAEQDFAGCVSETSSTAAVITEVAASTSALGYISLGSVAENASRIKAVNVEGVEPTTENILSGDYVLSRPFNVLYQSYDGLSDVAKDFLSFILSVQGQTIIEDEGYIQLTDEKVEYTASGLTGNIEISGSTSVQPVMNTLAAAYMQLNSGVHITVEGGGSGVGITDAQNGNVDFGMASRDLHDDETGIVAHKIADDGIAVVVSASCPLTNVTLDQLFNLYMNGTAIEAV